MNIEEIKKNIKISVDIDQKTVFAEAEFNSIHVLLETTNIESEYDIELTYNDVEVKDKELLKAIDLFIYEYALNIINNDTPVFDDSDKQNATNLIYA